MDLTPENKDYIDSLSLEELLRQNRFCLPGNPWFLGETGSYWMERMHEKRQEEGPEAWAAASKRIGWGD